MSYLYKPETSNALVQPVKDRQVTLYQGETPHTFYKPVASPEVNFPVSLQVEQMYRSLAKYSQNFEERKKTVRPFLEALARSSYRNRVPSSLLFPSPKRVEEVPAPYLPVEYATLAPVKVAAKIEDAVYGAEKEFWTALATVLRWTTGRVAWVTPTIVRYDYLANDQSETTVSRFTQVSGNSIVTTTNGRIDTVMKIIYDELLNAKRHPVTYSDNLPERVRYLIQNTPNWLLRLLSKIDGTLVNTREFEIAHNSQDWTHVASEPVPQPVRQTYDYDPCICLGDLVLVGWVEGEV